MDRRKELLRAAARVFAQHGFRGSTTRRIAIEAGVNEVTIFRYFGSKDALLREAITCASAGSHPAGLPEVPVDPARELTAWSQSRLAHLHSMRDIIRQCMSEREEHPALSSTINNGPIHAATELRNYLSRLRDNHLVTSDFDEQAAVAMLMGALFADAMGRDLMPDLYPHTPQWAAEQYTQMLLRALGVVDPAATCTASSASDDSLSHSRP